ncbi:MAG: ribonuclease P protein component [Methylocystis sp.]|nr:ribonuclease P protein component [Methylocystis sp.]MBI3275014.1 ribonuclease P protein component [Methylocystis sp.]
MTTNAPAQPHAAKTAPQRLRRRRDFLHAAASGVRHSMRVFSLQAAERENDRETPARFGFTVTKKTAGAVGRNRIRRRLKEALRVNSFQARPGYDYVFIARPAALTAPFRELLLQVADGLANIHALGKSSKRRNRKNRPSAS